MFPDTGSCLDVGNYGKAQRTIVSGAVPLPLPAVLQVDAAVISRVVTELRRRAINQIRCPLLGGGGAQTETHARAQAPPLPPPAVFQMFIPSDTDPLGASPPPPRSLSRTG